MHTVLKISDLLDNGVPEELAPFFSGLSATTASLRWLGGLYTFWRGDLLFLSADGLPHSFVKGANKEIQLFKRAGMSFTVQIELDERCSLSFVKRVNHTLASLLAEQITTGDKGLSQGTYTYGITAYGESVPTTATVTIQHHSEAP